MMQVSNIVDSCSDWLFNNWGVVLTIWLWFQQCVVHVQYARCGKCDAAMCPCSVRMQLCLQHSSILSACSHVLLLPASWLAQHSCLLTMQRMVRAACESFCRWSVSHVLMLCCDMQAGLSGAIAIHAIYSTDETVLFFERPHVNPANPEVIPNPYLTVSHLK